MNKFWLRMMLLLVIALPVHAWAQETSPSAGEKKLIVGTKDAPPFAIKTHDGNWEGIGIDLWRKMAADLELDYEWREFELPELLEAVRNGSVAAAVAAITVTAERDREVDFTHPFYSTGLGIAVASDARAGWIQGLKRLFSGQFLSVVGLLAIVLALVGVVVWVLERRKNPEQFGGSAASGIGAGFWWSAVTMTTVGYGDKSPTTLGGRLLGIIWMFAGIIVISSFTAAITSALTVTQLESKVRGMEDLPRVSVGSVQGTTSEASLRDMHIRSRVYETPLEGLQALSRGEIDAMVYDAPILRYLINQDFRGALEMLPKTFERQDYAVALPPGSPLREPLNYELLIEIQDNGWQGLINRYLGQ